MAIIQPLETSKPRLMNKSQSIQRPSLFILISSVNASCLLVLEQLSRTEVELATIVSNCQLLIEQPCDRHAMALDKLKIPFEVETLEQLAEAVTSLHELISDVNSQLKLD